MEDNEIVEIIENQRKFLKNNPKIDIKYRKKSLKRLYKNIKDMSDEISDALKTDLNKCKTESYMTEIGIVLGEISYMLKHLRSLSRKKRVYTPISNFPAKSYKIPSAYGIVLIMSPWNYPFMLALDPLVDAIAAGNTVILKPSRSSPNVTSVIDKLIKKTFESCYVASILCSEAQRDSLLEQDFDYIFYTGSTRIGQIVMKKAAERFIPVTLEMGGKSPCIVDETADLKLAAKRIVFGKLLNCGQTCVAPDYIFCHEKVKDKLVSLLQDEIIRQYTVDPLFNENYPKMINKKQFDFVTSLIDKNNVIFGGNFDEKTLKIEPTILNANFDQEIMKNEIFGPLMPIVTFKTLDEVVEKVTSLNKPLALYYFSNSRKNQEFILSHCQFGGGCINDTIMHIANNHMGFGGIKHSGIGAYHGKIGFQTFTHYKSVVKKSNLLDLPLRYQPFTKFKEKLIKLFLK